MEISNSLATTDQSITMPPSSPSASKLDALRNLPARLDDTMLAKVRDLAVAPLRPLPAITSEELDVVLLGIFSLPKQKSGDELGADIKMETYHMVLGDMPLLQARWMLKQIIKTCLWVPPPAKCLTIAEGWKRADDATEARRLAALKVKNEEFARVDQRERAIQRLQDGRVTQAEFSEYPEWLIAALVRRREIGWCAECKQAVLPRRRPVELSEEALARIAALFDGLTIPTQEGASHG